MFKNQVEDLDADIRRAKIPCPILKEYRTSQAKPINQDVTIMTTWEGLKVVVGEIQIQESTDQAVTQKSIEKYVNIKTWGKQNH